MKTAVAYTRVSTTEQASEGISLAAQEAAISAYCALRQLELAALIVDSGVSAGKPLAARPGGAELLAAVKGRKVEAVVAYKLDRLFRNAADCLGTTAVWDKAGVALHLIDLGGSSIDTASAMGRFFLTVMAGAAEMERGLIAERTAAVMAHMRRQGEHTGGEPPYGLAVAADGKTLEDNPQERATIGRILRMRADGVSHALIADTLNAEGIPARGRCWHKTTIVRLVARLQNAVEPNRTAIEDGTSRQ